MKRKPTKFWTSMAMRLAIAAGTALPAMWATSAKAVIIPATQTPTSITANALAVTSGTSVSAVYYMNSDMIETATGTLTAIVYNAEINGSTLGSRFVLLHLSFKDASGTYTADRIINGYWGYSGTENEPDVAIAHNGSGNDFTVGVIFGEYTDNIVLRTVDIIISPTGTPRLNTVSINPAVQPIGGGRVPHIDIVADPSATTITGNGFYPTMTNFVATWIDYTTSPSELRVASDDLTGSLSAFTTTTYPATVTGNLQWSDVAAVHDFTSVPNTKAYVVYTEHGTPGDLKVAETDYTGPTLLGITTLSNNRQVKTPRIEAYGHRTNPNNAAWAVLSSSSINTTFPYGKYGVRTYLATNTGPLVYNPSAAYTSTFENYPSGVAAGIGPSWGPNIGNDLYSIAYAASGYNFLHGQFYHANGTQPPALANHYNLNNTSGISSAHAVAISTSNNSGYDLVSAWYDGTNILKKYSNNLPQYKPTGIENKYDASIQMYPNPAADILHVKGAGKADYHVADMTGKCIVKGSVDKEQVDLRALSNGIYIINVTDEQGISTSMKFTKQ